MRLAFVLVYLASTALSHQIGSSKPQICKQDSKFSTLMPIKQSSGHTKPSNRILQFSHSPKPAHQQAAPTWHPIRIDLDTSFSDVFVLANPSLNAKYNMAKKIIDSVRLYFQSIAKVQYTETFSFPGGSCFLELIPKFEKKADLVVVLTTENDPSTEYVVASTACFLSDLDERPMLGALVVNYAFLEFGDLQEFLYFSHFAHEFTHLLGFSKSLFGKYVHPGSFKKRQDVMGNITLGQEIFPAVTMPEVVSFAREYFGCESLQGMPLENDGGSEIAGSHWEKLFLPQEFMNHISENPAVISEFTLVFFRATGWYQIEAGASEKYSIGKGAGCQLFNVCPASTDNYCTEAQASQTLCADNWMGKASCVRDLEFGSGCYFKKAKMHSCMMGEIFQQDSTETYDVGSRCFNYVADGEFSAKCHSASCSDGQVIISVGDQRVVCLPGEKGQRKNVGGRYSLECPDAAKFCKNLDLSCPNDCSAQGLCRQDKRCSCFSGWTGDDCSIQEMGSVDFSKPEISPNSPPAEPQSAFYPGDFESKIPLSSNSPLLASKLATPTGDVPAEEVTENPEDVHKVNFPDADFDAFKKINNASALITIYMTAIILIVSLSI